MADGVTPKKNRWHPAFVDRDYIQLARKARAENDGAEPAAKPRPCRWCSGTGKVFDPRTDIFRPCDLCAGRRPDPTV